MNEAPTEIHEAQANAFGDARMTWAPARPLASWAITMGAGGLFLGFIGATDSYQYALPVRLGFWLGLCGVAGLLAVSIEAALARFVLRKRGMVIWWAALTLCLALAMVPVIFLVNSTGASSPIADLPVFARNSLAISAALVALRLGIGALLSQSQVSAAPTAATGEQDQAQAPILRRLPGALQSTRLLALKSEGHYVQVYTDMGNHLLLMRFGDAVDETAPIDGMQVHRSWWIARAAIGSVERSEGKWEIVVGESLKVPVSRTYRSKLRDKGWA